MEELNHKYNDKISIRCVYKIQEGKKNTRYLCHNIPDSQSITEFFSVLIETGLHTTTPFDTEIDSKCLETAKESWIINYKKSIISDKSSKTELKKQTKDKSKEINIKNSKDSLFNHSIRLVDLSELDDLSTVIKDTSENIDLECSKSNSIFNSFEDHTY